MERLERRENVGRAWGLSTCVCYHAVILAMTILMTLTMTMMTMMMMMMMMMMIELQ